MTTLLTAKDVCERIKVCRSQLNKIRIKDTTFPKPVVLPGNTQKLYWRDVDLETWVKGLQIAEA